MIRLSLVSHDDMDKTWSWTQSVLNMTRTWTQGGLDKSLSGTHEDFDKTWTQNNLG